VVDEALAAIQRAAQEEAERVRLEQAEKLAAIKVRALNTLRPCCLVAPAALKLFSGHTR